MRIALHGSCPRVPERLKILGLWAMGLGTPTNDACKGLERFLQNLLC